MTIPQGYELLIAATVFVGCTAIQALSIIAFAKGLTATHAARLHASQAAATEQTLEHTERALQGAPARSNGYVRPRKEDFVEGIMMQREIDAEGEMGDADVNAGLDENFASVGGSGDAYNQERFEE